MRRRAKWIGRLHLTTTRQAFGAPRIDGCGSTVVEVDDAGETVSMSYASGYAIRVWGREAIVIGVRTRHARCPRPPGMWLRMKIRHLRWVLNGRPPIQPVGFDASFEEPYPG